MEMQFRSRNHDLGAFVPTFQERVNTMLPAGYGAATASSAAPALDALEEMPITPHFLNNEEVQQTLARMEEQAMLQSEDLAQVHAGLNEERVARLLGLLDD